MRLICVRHGESIANAGAATTDPLSIGLTEIGRRQASELAQVWLEPPALFVISPAARAYETAVPSLQRFPQVPVERWPVEEFTYLSPQRCAGTTMHDRRQWVADYWDLADPQHQDACDAESFEGFISRVTSAIERGRAQPAERDRLCLLFGHGQFINAMRWLETAPASNLDMRSFRAFDLAHPVANCQRVEIDLQAFAQRRSGK